MRKNLGFYCFLFLSAAVPAFGKSAITYMLNGGRFGDNLINYAKAKWLVYKNPRLDFYYMPFNYSDSLKICELDRVFKKGIENNYGSVVRFYEDKEFKLGSEHEVRLDLRKSNFYISSYYAKIAVNWADENFLRELRKTISPRIFVKKMDLPKDRISVALHVRKGGGHDNALFSDPEAENNKQGWGGFSDKSYPIKFPPDSFYIEQIRRLYEIVGRKPLYVYLFTDDPEPLRIVEKYKKNLDGIDIDFEYRRVGNKHNANVVEDFFSITKFDCLIRNGSNFSFMAGVIGDFKVLIGLDQAHWEDDKWVADVVCTKIKI